MANFPTTTAELDEYIGNYISTHLTDIVQDIEELVEQAVARYMQNYGAAIEDNGPDGEVPLMPDDQLNPDNMTVILARMSNGVPTKFFQATVRALAIVTAKYLYGEIGTWDE